MHFSVTLLLWFTSATAFVALADPLMPARRSGKRPFLNGARSISQLSSSLRLAPNTARRQTRLIKWVSFKEFKSLLEQASEDLVVLDLRVDTREAHFPIAEAFVLPVMQYELMEILVWLPPSQSVVLYRADALCIASIEVNPSIERSAPIYSLDERVSRLEPA